MPEEVVKSVSEALNDVTEESLDVQDNDETTDDTVAAASDEGAEEGGAEEDAAEETAEEDEGEEEEEPEGETDYFDTLTPEQLQRIKDDPGLNSLRKELLKSYEAKTTEIKQLVQLGEAWRQNPRAVVNALAQSLNLTVSEARQMAAAAGAMADAADAQKAQQADPLDQAGKELEALFGAELGPRVRSVFDKWADARIGKRIDGELTPIKGTLGQVVTTNEQNRMLSEESTFKSRMGNKLNPTIEKRIVQLGNSGKYVPGKGVTPQEYLDSLYDLATAQIAREQARKASGTAAKKLARKIEDNRRDREPSGHSGRGGSVKPVSKVTEARSISEALDIANAELDAEGF